MAIFVFWSELVFDLLSNETIIAASSLDLLKEGREGFIRNSSPGVSNEYSNKYWNNSNKYWKYSNKYSNKYWKWINCRFQAQTRE